MENFAQCLFCLSAIVAVCSSYPSQAATSQNSAHLNKTSSFHQPEISAILPENADRNERPDLSHFEEVKESDIPEDAVVLMVEEQFQNHENGEMMDTASNVAFRPLFRYRQKETQRISNRRTRRRYYVPRRSYRDTYYPSYYRPYRSTNLRRRYSNDRLYYGHYPVLA